MSQSIVSMIWKRGTNLQPPINHLPSDKSPPVSLPGLQPWVARSVQPPQVRQVYEIQGLAVDHVFSFYGSWFGKHKELNISTACVSYWDLLSKTSDVSQQLNFCAKRPNSGALFAHMWATWGSSLPNNVLGNCHHVQHYCINVIRLDSYSSETPKLHSPMMGKSVNSFHRNKLSRGSTRSMQATNLYSSSCPHFSFWRCLNLTHVGDLPIGSREKTQ